MEDIQLRSNDTSELTAEKRKELTNRALARQVVQEILKFTTNEAVFKEIIRQLALELEDRETMLKIFEFLGDNDVQHERKIYT